MGTIELVVFDMAGTTVHDEDSVNRCVRDALAAAGLVVTPAEVNRVMGLPKPEAIAILVERSGRRADLADRLEAIHRDFVARSIAFYRERSLREGDTRRDSGFRGASAGGCPGRPQYGV